ncbi:BatA domain-containing protein [Polaribacter litorisediminis]|uniref:BatA domain-containing protein n=1 Tax=Polaribacter litorisediminis TaxID=1908341 RepID=UPI001CBC887D|nr:BatA domain-containing protein [Polaribacter litorisediminis]UAM97135.1 BatA domain-containing protein [Polaribacter litorisediminis]
MSFVNPTYLWAFLGLLVPLAIHFWSNKEGKVIKIGSIQFLEASDSSQSKSIQLNEYVLLLLRLLLMSLLVLLLAEPQLNQESKNTSLTYIVEPSLLENSAVKSMIETIDSDTQIRVLTSKFPEIELYNFDNELKVTPNYWQLTEQMESLKTDSIVVFTKGLLSGIKGLRPTINKPIKWIVLEDEKAENVAPVLAYKNDSKIKIVSVKVTSNHLSFHKKIVPINSKNIIINDAKDSITINSKKLPLKLTPKLSVLINYDENFSDQLFYMEASLRAIEKYANQEIKIEKTQGLNNKNLELYSLVIWLSKENHPTLKTKLLKYSPDNLALNAIEKSDTKNTFYLTNLQSAKKIIENDFTEQLFKILNLDKIDKSEFNKIDERVISEKEIQTNFKSSSKKSTNLSLITITNWLWMPFIFFLIVERIFAKIRKQ